MDLDVCSPPFFLVSQSWDGLHEVLGALGTRECPTGSPPLLREASRSNQPVDPRGTHVECLVSSDPSGFQQACVGCRVQGPGTKR